MVAKKVMKGLVRLGVSICGGPDNRGEIIHSVWDQ